MSSLRPLIPLLIAAAILLGGNGLQGTLIALRGAQEGFPPAVIGLMGTAYFAGFLIGCVAVVRILRAVGHIRAFSALAAMAASGTLLLAIMIDPTAWTIIRFVSGFCFAGLFTVIESWINSGVANQDRARVLSIYRIVDLCAVTGSQFLIPVIGVDGFVIFAVMSIMITLSLVPVSLGDRSNPKPPENVKFDLARAWAISPLGAIGCISVGVTNSAFRTLSPVYAQQIGLTVTDVAAFVSVSIIGGALIQYPLGYVSDKWDRRKVLIVTSSLALASALGLALFTGGDRFANFAIVFIFGAFAMPLFSLSAAHANDRAEPGEYVMLNAALMLFYSIGAIGGPFAAAFVMEFYGPHALFVFIAAVYVVFILIILYRMRVRSSVPAGERGRFAALLRTSLIFGRLVGRAQRNRKTGEEALQQPEK
jgi:MFS family permease